MSERFSPCFETRDEALTYVKARTRGQTGDYNWTKEFQQRVVDRLATVSEHRKLAAALEEMAKVAEFDIPAKSSEG